MAQLKCHPVPLKIRGMKGVMMAAKVTIHNPPNLSYLKGGGNEKGGDFKSPPFGNSGLGYHTLRVLKMSTMTTITRTAPIAITIHTQNGVGAGPCWAL